MTETKDTDTTQTMRARLREHGLPEAWAEWVREIAIAPPGEPRSYEVDFLFAPTAPTRRVFPMGDARTDHPAGFYDRTDDEMIEAWAEYATKREEWRAKYGDVATICKPAPASSHYTVRVEGNGNVVLLSGSSDAGPWRVESVTVPTANYRVHAVGIGVSPGEWIGREPGAVYSRDGAAEKKPKLSADDITAALWDMPGKERTVVLYPFWPAISEAAQRTHHAEEKATAAMAVAAHARLLLNDCQKALAKAEEERDAARKERDEARLDAGRLRNELSRARQQVGARENESIAEALQSIVVALEHERNGALTQRDDALRKLAEATPLPTGASGMVQGADGWEYPKEKPRIYCSDRCKERARTRR